MIAPSLPLSDAEVLQEAHEALANQLFHLRRNLTCEYLDGLLVLKGRVTSYYHKQVAQEMVLRLDAVEQVVNQIEVVPV